jgi:hypothetical protein
LTVFSNLSPAPLPYEWDIQGDAVTITVSHVRWTRPSPAPGVRTAASRGGWRPNPGADETVNIPYDIPRGCGGVKSWLVRRPEDAAPRSEAEVAVGKRSYLPGCDRPERSGSARSPSRRLVANSQANPSRAATRRTQRSSLTGPRRPAVQLGEDALLDGASSLPRYPLPEP